MDEPEQDSLFADPQAGTGQTVTPPERLVEVDSSLLCDLVETWQATAGIIADIDVIWRSVRWESNRDEIDAATDTRVETQLSRLHGWWLSARSRSQQLGDGLLDATRPTEAQAADDGALEPGAPTCTVDLERMVALLRICVDAQRLAGALDDGDTDLAMRTRQALRRHLDALDTRMHHIHASLGQGDA